MGAWDTGPSRGQTRSMDPQTYETLLVDVDTDGVAVVTLNRPERMNAWNDRMSEELSRAFARLDADDDVRVIVLTGAGRAFCAGADLSSGGDTFAGTGESTTPSPDDLGEVFPYMVRKPVIAAINGHAIGVGITYPLQCDVRFVAEDAKLQFAFVRRGVIPELGSHTILARVCGLSNAADLLLSGRVFSGREAVELGLATRALPAAEVLPAAMAWARDTAVNAAPLSTAVAKRLLWEGLLEAPYAMKRREDPVFAAFGRAPDAAEGVTAFLEKRPPHWKGRVSADYGTRLG